ncbi:DUF6292 family protein [Marinitenerispora sediminis]|uniref:DUF6292 domain-containing protein n=1 Tax=Marinitenerispora sediminis TaxID=1931232 RepID=A0A368T6H4_9ACTN|nr:DUF6292 family protein [Marinitenerispora sediminis]RCV53495.1 hypothetical protein DEF23_17605 [Marinitenerispora sediminis]RCV59323.1 hypothetical protein DEF24_10145 [Marinitenerispora sediminis]
MTDRLPHDDYADEVTSALHAAGWPSDTACWTESPDGERLEIAVRRRVGDLIRNDEWPHGCGIGWDQREGWIYIYSAAPGAYPNVDYLTDELYAAPGDVAAAARLLAAGRLDQLPFPGHEWEHAGQLRAAVAEWEADAAWEIDELPTID